MIDYHIHTELCNHAVGSMPDYVQRAVELGFREICFLDHLTLQEAGARLSMTPGEVPLYFQAVQRLKLQFKDRIRVKAGLEVDFNPIYVAMIEDIIGTYAFDVIGSSLHFPQGVDVVNSASEWAGGKMDTDYIFRVYLENLVKMMDYTYFDIICHMDLPKKFGRKPSRPLESELDHLIKRIRDRDLTVELNTSGFHHVLQEPYPSPEILKRCCSAGITVTLGSDSHRPRDVGRSYDKAFAVLKAAGYREVAVFDKRRRSMIPLT